MKYEATHTWNNDKLGHFEAGEVYEFSKEKADELLDLGYIKPVPKKRKKSKKKKKAEDE